MIMFTINDIINQEPALGGSGENLSVSVSTALTLGFTS